MPCSSCHPQSLARFDQSTCHSCHQQRDPAFQARHDSTFGTNCLLCHKTGGGLGNFNHSMFPLNHGNRGVASACTVCHTTKDYRAYTCFGCHAHTPSNVVREHEGKSLAQIQDCVKCHVGGRKGDN